MHKEYHSEGFIFVCGVLLSGGYLQLIQKSNVYLTNRVSASGQNQIEHCKLHCDQNHQEPDRCPPSRIHDRNGQKAPTVSGNNGLKDCDTCVPYLYRLANRKAGTSTISRDMAHQNIFTKELYTISLITNWRHQHGAFTSEVSLLSGSFEKSTHKRRTLLSQTVAVQLLPFVWLLCWRHVVGKGFPKKFNWAVGGRNANNDRQQGTEPKAFWHLSQSVSSQIFEFTGWISCTPKMAQTMVMTSLARSCMKDSKTTN